MEESNQQFRKNMFQKSKIVNLLKLFLKFGVSGF